MCTNHALRICLPPVQGVVTLPAAGQPASCTDSLTKLPPPFDFQAPVSALPEGERGLLVSACYCR